MCEKQASYAAQFHVVRDDEYWRPSELHNILKWLLEQAPAGRSINASTVQLEAWREDAAIQAFLRSEELCTLNLDFSTLKLGRRKAYSCEGKDKHAWRDHSLAALLGSMPQITSLNLKDSRRRKPYFPTSQLQNPDPIALLCRSICGLAGLRSLCVRGFFRPMNDHSMSALADTMHRMTQLEALDLRDNIFSKEHVPMLSNALQGLSGLTDLRLFGSGDIHQCFLARDDVFVEGKVLFAAIGRLPSLRTLYIMQCGNLPFSEDIHTLAVATALSDALLGLTQLVALDLLYHTFCQDGASSLASSLQRLTGLTELRMGVGVIFEGTTIDQSLSANTAEAVLALTAPLNSLTSLTKLETYNGPVADGTMQALAAAIQKMPGLVSIELGHYGFGCDGAKVIAGALVALTGLTKLGMGGNNIRDAGSFEVARAIECLPRLTELDLDNALSHSGSDGAIAIAKALSNLTRLKILRIRMAKSPDPSSAGEWQHLRDALLGMPLLEDLAIDYEPRDLDWGIPELGIESLPDEIFRRGWISTLDYVRKISTQGGKRCGMLRLLIVGMAEAGKTCLRKAILNTERWTEEIDVDDRTIGIEIDAWKPQQDLDFSVCVSIRSVNVFNSCCLLLWYDMLLLYMESYIMEGQKTFRRKPRTS